MIISSVLCHALFLNPLSLHFYVLYGANVLSKPHFSPMLIFALLAY